MPITLIVEDGTRPTGANTYASAADADAYHADRSFTAWDDATDDEKATALIKATAYLNGLAWLGRKVAKRKLAWPRADMTMDGYAIGFDEIPDAVVDACCHMAGEIVGGADPYPVIEREIVEMTVGPIGTRWAPGSNPLPRYPAVESLLRGLIGSRGVIPLLRG
jgi:hypothetical protein